MLIITGFVFVHHFSVLIEVEIYPIIVDVVIIVAHLTLFIFNLCHFFFAE
jgi:hypothetical protein